MLRANALFIVVVISLLIGILCSSLIMMSYFQRMQVQKDLIIKRLDLNCHSGINILLGDYDQMAYDELRIMDLFGEENDSVLLKKSRWGIYEIATVKAFSGVLNKTKAILYGHKPDDVSSSGIYLTDQNRPLSLGGNTYIKGTCYLPEAGVKRAYIEGQSFSGSTLINGTTRKSNALPPLNHSIIKNISDFFLSSKETLDNGYGSEQSEDRYANSSRSKDKAFIMEEGGKGRLMIDEEGRLYYKEITEDEKNAGQDLAERSILSRSFLEKPLIIYQRGTHLVKEKKYSGNIIICSDKLVIVDSSAKLDNVLIFAPAIVVNDHFQGNLQMFATDSIRIGKNCNFLYPSAIGLLKRDFEVVQPYIKIDEKTSFKGIIFTYAEVFNLQETLVVLEKDVFIEGQIFANGFVDTKGTVWGNISCNRFTLRTPSSIYDNHLFNTTIDHSKLSPYFVGSSLVPSKKQKAIISWLE